MDFAFVSSLFTSFSPAKRVPALSERRPPAVPFRRRPRVCIQASTELPRQVEFTPLGNNTFVLEGAGARLLIDPFLVDELVFFSPAFFRLAKEPSLRGLDKAGRFDAVILTQYLPDHAHEPTLRAIDRVTPIVAPPSAEKLLIDIGFTDVRILRHDENVNVAGVNIVAGRGSVVGPPGSTPMNALVFDFDGLRVYHEPHGYHDDEFLAKYNGIDAAVAPIVSATIPAIRYSLVNGAKEAIGLARQLRPKTLVGFDNSGGETSGWLATVIDGSDGRRELRDAFQKEKDLTGVHFVIPERQMVPIVIASEAKEIATSGVQASST